MREASDFFKRAYLNGSVKNELTILIYGNGSELPYVINNDEIVSESMKLTQSLCDDSDLKFGGCIASQFEIEITKNVDLTGRGISVRLYQTAVMPTYPGSQTYPTTISSTEDITTYPGLTVCKGYNGNPIWLFKGKIYSCKLSKNRIIRKIVAYDDFYWKGTVNCTNWYRSLFKNVDTITLGKLFDELLKKFNFRKATAIENLTLPANDLPVYMVEDKVTVGELLRQIMEFNGFFCFIDGDGFLDFISFRDYSQVETNYEIYHYYIDVATEDFTKTGYTGLYIAGFEDGTGRYYFDSSSDENYYFLEDINIITKSYKARYFDPEFQKIKSLLNSYFSVIYDPINLKSEYRSWVELGDKIQVYVTWYDINGKDHIKTFDTMVLSRTLSGIQAITDEITSNAENIRYTEEYFDGD